MCYFCECVTEIQVYSGTTNIKSIRNDKKRLIEMNRLFYDLNFRVLKKALNNCAVLIGLRFKHN